MFFLLLLEIDYFLGFFTRFIKQLNFNFSGSLNKILVLAIILVVSLLFIFFLLLLDRKNQGEDNLEWLNDFNAAIALIFYAAGFLLLRGNWLYGLKHLEIGLADYWDFIYYGLIWFLPSILIIIRPSFFFSGAYRKIYRICAVTFVSFFLLAIGYNVTKAVTCDFNRKYDCVAQKHWKRKTILFAKNEGRDGFADKSLLPQNEQKLDDVSFCEKVSYDYRCVRNIAINKKKEIFANWPTEEVLF